MASSSSPTRAFQVMARDRAKATGHGFDHCLDADPLAAETGDQEAMASEEPVYLPIGRLDGIVLRRAGLSTCVRDRWREGTWCALGLPDRS